MLTYYCGGKLCGPISLHSFTFDESFILSDFMKIEKFLSRLTFGIIFLSFIDAGLQCLSFLNGPQANGHRKICSGFTYTLSKQTKYLTKKNLKILLLFGPNTIIIIIVKS